MEGRGKKYAAIKHSCNKTACNNRPAYFKKLICRRTNCLVSRETRARMSALGKFNLLASLLDIFFFFLFSPLLIFPREGCVSCESREKETKGKSTARFLLVSEKVRCRGRSVVANLRNHKSSRERGVTHSPVEIWTTEK